MFDKFLDILRQLFGGGTNQNPLEQLSVDELRAARVKLERSRDRTLKQIGELEARKAEFFEQGVHSDGRTRKDIARRIKETEEQVRHLDQQLVFFGKQIQIISRLAFLRDNRDQMVELGIDRVLGKMDTGELRTYIDEISLRGAVSGERLTELSALLEEALGAGLADEEDPEIARLVAAMEEASMPADDLSIPEVEPARPEPAESEPPPREPPLPA